MDPWTIMSTLAINILVQGTFWTYVFIFLGKIPKKKLLVHREYVCLLTYLIN